MTAFIDLGFTKKERECIMRITACCMHMGNLELATPSTYSETSNKCASFKNID
jgi:myosin heavy subunit